MIDLQQLEKAANALEPLSESATRLASLSVESQWSMQEVVNIIKLDQVLTARILRAANSASLGARATILNVKDAVVRLGLGQVVSLCIGNDVRGRMQAAVPEYGLAEGELWRHSVAAALAAEAAPAFCRTRIPPESFSAALLHDFGKLIIARQTRHELLEYLRAARDMAGMPVSEAEKEILEVHHGELGGLIAQHWGLPEGIVLGAIYHHNPEEGHHIVCDVTHLANVVALTIGAGSKMTTSSDQELQPGSRKRLGMDEKDFDVLCQRVESSLEEVLSRYEGGR